MINIKTNKLLIAFVLLSILYVGVTKAASSVWIDYTISGNGYHTTGEADKTIESQQKIENTVAYKAMVLIKNISGDGSSTKWFRLAANGTKYTDSNSLANFTGTYKLKINNDTLFSHRYVIHWSLNG